MRTKLLFILFSFGIAASLPAQRLELQAGFPTDEPTAVSADAQGNIYLATKEGEIKKYNSRGLLLNTFSPQSAGFFNVLDGSSSLQVKAFSENSQTLIYLDRFLNRTASFQLPSDHFSYITALCWSAGNTIWMAAAAERELVRWSIDTREVITTLNLNQFVSEEKFKISLLKEHQHKLYLFSPNRLYIFDQMGNYEMQLPLPSWKGVAFSENELILLEDDHLNLMDLYSLKERKILLPAQKNYRHISFGNGEVFLFTATRADIYRIKP